MKRLSTLILVVTVAIVAACFGGKRNGRGTNVPPGGDDWPPQGAGQPPAFTGHP